MGAVPPRGSMRFLLVSRTFPYDPSRSVYGVFQRLGMFVEAMASLGDLDVLFYVRPGTDTSPARIAEVEERLARQWRARVRIALCVEQSDSTGNTRWDIYGKPALSYYRQVSGRPAGGREQLEALLASLQRGPDAVFVHRLQAMPALFRANVRLPPIFFDLDDVEHIALIRSLRRPPYWPGKKLYYLQLPALMLAERRAIRLATRTFVCSDEDRRRVSALYGGRRVVTVPNAVPLPTSVGSSGGKTCLFIGRYTYAPNVEAARFLMEEIWPRIRAAVPEARLLIAGERSEAISPSQAPAAGVELLGFTPDLDGLYAQAEVVCAPILSGSGTRIKIIEAASYGKAVVSTALGAEGLSFRDGSELLLRDDPDAFAGACIELLRDGELAKRIGLAARTAVERSYSRETVVERIRTELTSSMATSTSHRRP